jgi:hypothetical protein
VLMVCSWRMDLIDHIQVHICEHRSYSTSELVV